MGRALTSSAPAPVAWTVLAFSLVTLMFRLLWFSFGARPSERLITYGLLFGTASGLLREHVVQDWFAQEGVFDVAFTRQLSAAVMVVMFAPLLLLVASWSERTWAYAARSSRLVWATVCVSAALMLVVGTHSRALGDYIDRAEGWQTPLYFVIFSTWCGVPGILMVTTSVKELRAGDLRPMHRLTYLMIVIVGACAVEEALLIVVSSMCAATGTGSAYVEFRIRANENNYTYILGGGALVAAAGVATEFMRRLRLDPASRAIRHLTPMWEELVSACPEIPRPTRQDENMNPRRYVHRMTVEIRDALLVLGRYVGPGADNATGPAGESLQIARALHRKQSGAQAGQYRRLQASAPGSDIVDETRALRKIASHWEESRSHVQATPLLDGDPAK
ncbi:MAB_1171c family putative transporter [Nocardia sp. NPDC049190]|uniref:MAB_1171c family putative transporter n=1 Tax=Nocardia sp. NPDC049190 TaxID=3155650 RepID=UPI0033E65240